MPAKFPKDISCTVWKWARDFSELCLTQTHIHTKKIISEKISHKHNEIQEHNAIYFVITCLQNIHKHEIKIQK